MVSGIPQDVASPARASDPNPPFGNARQPAVRDGLQQEGLSGFRRGDDQTALTAPDRCDEVENTG